MTAIEDTMMKQNIKAAHDEKYKQREYNFDLIRVTAMFMVIMVHGLGYLETYAYKYNLTWNIVQFGYSLLFACNGLFFMVSGYFTLDKFDEIRDEKILYFYVKKLVKIVIPFLLISGVYYVKNVYETGVTHSVVFFVKDFLMNFLTGNISAHFWFMYYIIGAYIISPFIGRMLSSLSEKELKLYTIVSLILQIVITSVYFTNYSFSYQIFLTVGLVNWLFYYQLGYTIKKLDLKINIMMLWGALILALLISLVEKRFISANNPYVDNQSLTMIVTTVSIFYLLKDYAKIHFKKLISVLAQHSYTVYMIHMLILDKMYAQFKGLDFLNNFYMYADWFARYVAVCIIVIIFAVLIDKLIFNPITNMIQKRILH